MRPPQAALWRPRRNIGTRPRGAGAKENRYIAKPKRVKDLLPTVDSRREKTVFFSPPKLQEIFFEKF